MSKVVLGLSCHVVQGKGRTFNLIGFFRVLFNEFDHARLAERHCEDARLWINSNLIVCMKRKVAIWSFISVYKTRVDSWDIGRDVLALVLWVILVVQFSLDIIDPFKQGFNGIRDDGWCITRLR